MPEEVATIRVLEEEDSEERFKEGTEGKAGERTTKAGDEVSQHITTPT